MVATQFLLAGFIAAASATTSSPEEFMFAKLLKRQEPGTPAYNCHDACGTAITIAKEGNPCDNEVFKTDYENCLICSGPDNYDIWRYYGRTLSTAGKACGLETEPKSGKQPDIGPAVHQGHSSSAAPAGSTAAPSVATTPTAGSPTAAVPVPTSTPEAPSDSSTTPILVSTSSGVAPTSILSSAGTVVPSSSANGTASFTSSPPEQTVNAAANVGVAGAAGVLGAIFVGAFLAI